MNLLLLQPGDLLSGSRYRVRREIAGEEIVVGVIDGRVGSGCVVERGSDFTDLDVTLDREPPAPLPLTLILALPRPKVLNRVIASAASMGIKRIFLINSWRVEKSYWKSPKLQHLRDHAILGLEQARDTVMPQIETRRLFRPFVEGELGSFEGRKLVAHPYADRECPRGIDEPVTLAIGPEGGFIDEEIASLKRIGFEAVSVGPRILRVETAVASIVGRLF
jgi:16S rRNA (uracil1498-N3)-methyltransferase